jgi:hypothetical protein
MQGRWHGVSSAIETDRRACAPAAAVVAREREEGMLFYCRFTWYPGVNRAMVARRLIQQHELGTNHPERIRGWYTLAGGGAGFMIVEADRPHEVSEILEPYMDIMSWDVHAIAETPYEETIEQMKKELTLG